MQQISSKDNPAVRGYQRVLASRRYRRETGLFAAEGPRLLADALQSGVQLRRLFLTERALERWGSLLLPLSHGDYTLVTEEVARALADTDTPQGVFGLCVAPEPSEELPEAPRGYLLLCSLSDPGNVGSILRTAAALGVGVLLSADCPDLYSPKVLRASMGGVFKGIIAQVQDITAAARELTRRGYTLYGAAMGPDSRPVRSLSLMRVGVLIGNEARGLTNAELALTKGEVLLPMLPGSDSFSAAVAGAIFAWELANAGPGPTGGR